MQDTADNTPAAGQPNDEAAPIADVVTPPEPPASEEQAKTDPWGDPDAARKEIEKLRRESAGYRTKLREAEPQLTEYKQYLDSQKTEQQKLGEDRDQARAELAEARSTNARLMAAATYNIPVELIDLLGAGTSEEIEARAKLLAERLTTPAADRPASARPVEALTAGGRPAGDASLDPNAKFRAMFKHD